MFSAALKSGSASAPKDPQFNYVAMLLHGDGTNGAQNNTFLDSSTNNFTITRNGNTTQGSFSPYGSNWSNFFNASTALYNTTAPLLGSTASTFTAEAWVFLTATPTNASFPTMGTVITMNGQKTSNLIYLSFGITTSNTVSLYWYDGAGKACTSSGTVTLNQWTHIAASVNANAITLYINGTSQTLAGTTTLTNRAASVNQFTVGGNNYSTTPAYISNARVTNTAVYSASFTPSTTPLTAISGTQLLTCQSNRFLDNSTNAYALTVSGAPSIQRFNPFGAYTAYSTSVIGGSGYFDGTGDYLSVADNAALELGSGNWTIECFVNTSNSTAYSAVITRDDGGTTAGSYVILLNGATANGFISFYSADINGFSGAVLQGSIKCNDSAWHHIAVVRNSNTLTLYIDGVSNATATYSGAFANTAQPILIGFETGYARAYTGYISNVRYVIGTAVYTATFTPPTAPLTAISGTQLLLSTTNGAIFDNAMMNNLETGGNAQISTSVKKYGTGSLAFDGTGDFLKFPKMGTLGFSTGNFTIEMWVYPSANQASYAQLLNKGPTEIFNLGFYPSTTQLNFYNGGFLISASSSLTIGAWTHVALVRSGTTLTLYQGGVSVGSATYSTDVADDYGHIGCSVTEAGYFFNGYIDDLRITRGIARYTATFTPPTAAFPNIGPT